MATRTPRDGPIFPKDTSAGLISRLRKEIDKLRRDHADALRSAAFIAMTPEQATAHDQRRIQIKLLVQQLAALVTAE